MTNTLPEENFVEPAPRRGISRSTPPLTSPTWPLTGAPRGMPMSITSTVPACCLPGAIHSPGLARWNVAVAIARTASPSTWPVDALTPLGTSAAITRAFAALTAAMTSSAGARGAPSEPVPSSASTITCAPFRRASSNGSGDGPGSRLSISAASPCSHSAGHTSSTSTCRPAWRSSRAATSPSPPLLPLPQTTATRPPGAWRDTASASPSPARSIRSSDGIPRVSIAHASVSRICSASSSGSSQRGRLIG